MLTHRIVPLVLAVATGTVCAQISSAHPVGIHDVAWSNPTGRGTPVLTARVHYPATTAGVDTPVESRAGGWPVIVFLHGYSLFGSDYGDLGNGLAAAGFAAVMLETAQFSYLDMEHDAAALPTAIDRANEEFGGFFARAFDVDRVALMGHSMGASVVTLVLASASADDFRCGLSVSPVDPGPIASMVHSPMGVVCGAGDTITPPVAHARVVYDDLTPTQGLKFFYEMDSTCDHMNIAGLTGSDPSHFQRTLAIAVGFFGQFLGKSAQSIDDAIGPAALADAHLQTFGLCVVTPQVWSEGPLQVGHTTRVSVAAEAGLAGVLGAATTSASPVPTLFGELLLDPSSTFTVGDGSIVGQRLDVLVTVPPCSVLSGLPIAMQGVGPAFNTPFTLGSAMRLTVQ